MDLFNNYTSYEDCEPVGVELPTVSLEGDLANKSSYEALRELCLDGVKKRGIDKQENKQEYYDRVKYELEILEELGFTDYILLNWDIINYCHTNDIPVGDGRGSAAGSLVLYLLAVTNLDPIKYGLFFERFVSKNRAKKIKGKDGKTYLDGSLLADIDNDISYEHRQQVVDYIERKFEGRTAKILTFNTLTSKSCIGEAAKYFNHAKKEQVDLVSGMIPKIHGKVFALEKAREESEQFKEWTEEYPLAYSVALKLENLIKNTSVHASGIAISAKPINELVPLQSITDKDTKETHIVTGYDMNDVSALMVKFDILGLRTLSFLERACKRVGIKRSDIDIEDNFIYQQMQNYESPYGLFQISARTNFEVAQKVKPMNLFEMSDVVALARPGALAFVDDYVNNKCYPEGIEKKEESMDSILANSKFVLLYQEQVMAIAHKTFGLTLDDAEQLRRVIGKKKVGEVPKWKKIIYDAAEKKGLTKELADYFWGAVEASASYQFNLSHSICYASLASKTVYMKYKYPAEFFVSILEIADCFQEPLKVVEEINFELGSFNLELLPPNLQESDLDFTIEEGAIRYGLSSIKGVSKKRFEALVDFRKTTTKSKYDIFLAAKESGLNIGVLTSLIYCGALGVNKRGRLALEAQAFNLLTDREKRNFIKLKEVLGEDVLIAIDKAVKDKIIADDNRPLIKEGRFNTFLSKFKKYKALYLQNSKHEKFSAWWFEKHLLGYSYSYDLKDCFQDQYGTIMNIADLENLAPNERFRIVGNVSADVHINTSANNNRYARFPIADSTGEGYFLFCDNRRATPLSNFLQDNELNKGDLIVVSGSMGDDVFFINRVHKIETKIFTNIRQLK